MNSEIKPVLLLSYWCSASHLLSLASKVFFSMVVIEAIWSSFSNAQVNIALAALESCLVSWRRVVRICFLWREVLSFADHTTMILVLPFEGKMDSNITETFRHWCVCTPLSFVRGSWFVLLWEVANQLHTKVFLERQ